MKTMRRLAVLACAAWAVLPVQAQEYPAAKPITLIVPFPAGGATDVQARALARAASAELKQQIVILNQPGVAATLGPATMARQAKPDGYTIALSAGTLLRQPHLQKVNYDPLKDFTWIMGVAAYTTGITVKADAPWKTAKELFAYAKAHPGKVSYGTVGKGSTAHIAMSALQKAAGLEFNFVPFKGAIEVFTALQGGHLDVAAEAGFGSTVDSGKGRLLAVFNEQRTKERPDVPTVKELGYNVVLASNYGIAGPKGMDPKVVKTLHDAFKKAMDDPEFLRILKQNDESTMYMDSKAYTDWAARTYAQEKRYLTELNIQLD
ncbi:MAG: tripartite tricarboxylate transporter substrate binding protein [Acidovorax sp.]